MSRPAGTAPVPVHRRRRRQADHLERRQRLHPRDQRGPFSAKDYRTWAATLGAALLLCALEHPGSERGAKKCIKQVLDAVSTKLGHTPAVCRSSYIHPRVLDDFTHDRLAPQLAKQLHRRVGDVEVAPETIEVDTLRAIEPVVARYLDKQPRRRHA